MIFNASIESSILIPTIHSSIIIPDGIKDYLDSWSKKSSKRERNIVRLTAFS